VRSTIIFFFLCFLHLSLYAQNYPLYNGYFLNPYIYNPAAAATERLQVNAGYRRQWLEIPNSPAITSLTVNSLMDERVLVLGLSLVRLQEDF